MSSFRVLMMSQGVSLAHVARPAALAAALPDAEVHFARTARMARFVGLPHATQHELAETMTPDTFVARMAVGKPLFDEATLLADVDEDLRLIEKVQPDLIVGDLRFSLQVSARLAGVRFAMLSNAHWSPSLPLSTYPMPEHPVMSLMPRSISEPVFRKLTGFFFRQHVEPLNAMRRRHGFTPFTDMREGYQDADDLLFVDDAGFYPSLKRSTFLAPIVWEPPTPSPSWLEAMAPADDLALLTVGSTGAGQLMKRTMIETMRALGLRVMLATAERGSAPDGVLTAPYIPGYQAAKRSRLVVCNGGSCSTAQAIAAGRPFLGICSNMDQFLACQPLVAAGAGLVLPASQANASRVGAALKELMENPRYTHSARALQPRFSASLAPTRFRSWFDGVVGKRIAA